MTGKENQNYIIKSVDNALNILEVFLDKKDEYGVTELSKKLHLSKNNVFRLLVTLKNRGFIEQKQTGNYCLGIKTFEIGQTFRSRMMLLKLARPVLESLQAECNETVYIGIVREEAAIYLDMVETTLPVRVISMLGRLVPAYNTAIGKVQLAYESSDELECIIERVQFSHRTRNSIRDKEALINYLKKVVRIGYAIDNEEYEEGVVCVGAPVFDFTGQVVAGICISGPIPRMSLKRIENGLSKLVVEAAGEISRIIGYRIKPF